MPIIPTIHVWNDRNAYKRQFLLIGLETLARRGDLTLLLENYEYFSKRGAPEFVNDACNSLKNITVLEYEYDGKVLRAVYDANDIYYKIPPSLLAWCDLYFKSNFQEEYLRTGNFLSDAYWSNLPFFENSVTEPIDIRQFHKFRRANFSMELYRSRWMNFLHFRLNEGRWLSSAVGEKTSDLFFQGRYWHETAQSSLQLMKVAIDNGLRLSGGLVETKDPVPEEFVHCKRKAVGLAHWCVLASRARATVITRGLQGCVGFKPLNLLMIGSPFFANRFKSNLVQPLLEDKNYIPVEDDFSDLGEKFATTTEKQFAEMGARNFDFWCKVASPSATASYLCRELLKLR